jgi:hypothetical protein
VSSDGREWQEAETPVGWQGTYGGTNGVWTTPDGWEAFVGIDLEAALWQSRDGLTWQGPVSVQGPEPNLGAAGADPGGVRLMAVWVLPPGGEQVQQLLESSDGIDWTTLIGPPGDERAIQAIVPPSTGRRAWVAVTNRYGSDAAVLTTVDRTQWTSAPFPMPAVEDVVPTRYGLFAIGRVPCLDTGGQCPAARWTQFVSPDGLSWTKLNESVPAVRVADGPVGVIGVGQSTGRGKTKVWRLVEQIASNQTQSESGAIEVELGSS